MFLSRRWRVGYPNNQLAKTAYTFDHWNNKALPGLVCSATDSARSVAKLRRIAEETGALVVTGHDPDLWRSFKHAPRAFYD